MDLYALIALMLALYALSIALHKGMTRVRIHDARGAHRMLNKRGRS